MGTRDPRFDPVWRAEEEEKAARRRQATYDEYDDPRPDVGSGANRKVWVHVGGRWHGHWVLMPAEEAAEASQHDLDRMGWE